MPIWSYAGLFSVPIQDPADARLNPSLNISFWGTSYMPDRLARVLSRTPSHPHFPFDSHVQKAVTLLFTATLLFVIHVRPLPYFNPYFDSLPTMDTRQEKVIEAFCNPYLVGSLIKLH